MVKLHGKVASALCFATQIGCIAEHLGQGNIRVDSHYTVAHFRAGQVAATGRYVAHYVAEILVGYGDFYLHHRF